MKKIEDLNYRPMRVTHLGCVKGCLEYLNMEVSDAWLFGATGHAFILNRSEVVCPSGPTSWNTEMLFKLGRNIGYIVDGVSTHKSENDFAEKQKLAWEKTKKAIDQGLPCYGWELKIPEYYVVYGYDEKGMHNSLQLLPFGMDKQYVWVLSPICRLARKDSLIQQVWCFL